MNIPNVLESLANIATFLGIPLAIIIFATEKRRERLDREYGTYNALDDKYIEYLQICMDNPELDLYYLPIEKERILTKEEKIKQYALSVYEY